MKTILVPVDFSDYSEYALRVASNFAKQYDAEIIVLHMLGVSESVLTKDTSNQMLEGMFYVKLAEKQFKEFLDKDYLEGVKVTDEIYNYTVFSEINTLAKEYAADLIVMGSHGSTGLNEIFVGSNTEKVVRNSEIPVLVIKNEMDVFETNSAVFACDFKIENIQVYHKAMNFFNALQCDVKLLYVNLPGQHYRSTNQIEKRVELFLIEANNLDKLDSVIYVNDYTVEDGIFNFCNKNNIDIIALPTHGRRGLSHFFSGSISEDLVNHSTLPVITFKI